MRQYPRRSRAAQLQNARRPAGCRCMVFFIARIPPDRILHSKTRIAVTASLWSATVHYGITKRGGTHSDGRLTVSAAASTSEQTSREASRLIFVTAFGGSAQASPH